jgi:cytochrome P450
MVPVPVPVASGRLPLLGHALPLWRDPYSFLTRLRSAGEIVRVDLGALPVYFVTTSELTEQVMVTQGRSFERGQLFTRVRSLFGDGLEIAGNQTHRRHRRLLQPLFHRDYIAAYSGAMSRRALALAESWQSGQTVSVDKAMAQYVVDIMAESLFPSQAAGPGIEAIHRDFPTIVNTMFLKAMTPKALAHIPMPFNRRFDRATARLHHAFDDVISSDRPPEGDEVDMLSAMLAIRDTGTGEGLTKTEIRDELLSILFGAAVTTDSTLTWTLHEIARHPEVEKRLLAEIDTVVGTRPVSIEDVDKLCYAQQVFKEAIRMHSMTVNMVRATTDIELNGVILPAGTEVGFSPYALHRDPRYFPEPELFDPHRKPYEQSSDLPRHAFLPFAAGSHKCIGQPFALAEAAILLATVLARWQLRPLPGHTPRERIGVIPRPDHMPMIVNRRMR